MKPEIRYISEHNGNAFPTVLTISNSGLATLTVRTNRDNPGVGSVGLFRRQLDESETTWLVTALRSQKFVDITNPTSLVPGTPVEQLAIKEAESEWVVRYIPLGSSEAPYFRAITEKARMLMELVRQQPLRTMVMEMTSLTASHERGKPLDCRVIVRNPGTEPLQLPHPDYWRQESVGLQIRGIRSDVPLASRTMDHQRFENLSEEHLVVERSTKIERPLILNGGDQGIELTFRLSLDWPPGQYELTLEFTFPMALQEGDMLLPYAFVHKAGSIKIIGISKPEDFPDFTDEEEKD